MESKTATKLIGLAFFLAVPTAALAQSPSQIKGLGKDELPKSLSDVTDDPFGVEESMMSQPSGVCA